MPAGTQRQLPPDAMESGHHRPPAGAREPSGTTTGGLAPTNHSLSGDRTCPGRLSAASPTVCRASKRPDTAWVRRLDSPRAPTGCMPEPRRFPGRRRPGEGWAASFTPSHAFADHAGRERRGTGSGSRARAVSRIPGWTSSTGIREGQQPRDSSAARPWHGMARGPQGDRRHAMGCVESGYLAKAGTTSSMNSCSERFLSSWPRVLSLQKLYSLTPNAS